MAASSTSTSDKQTIYPVYVIFGSDRRRACDKQHEITDLVLAGADPQMALSAFDGPDATLADVIDDLRTLPFLSPSRLVVVKDADKFITKYRGELEKYLDNPSATGVLLLMPSSFPGNTRLAKCAKKIGQVTDCSPVKPRELPSYLKNYTLQHHNLVFQRSAVELLISLAGDDSGILLSEIDKIATYLGDSKGQKKQIAPEIVQNLVGNNRHFNVFNVIDAMTASDKSLALTRLDQMLSRERDAEFTAVGAFAWHFRRLYNARLLLDKGVAGQQIIRQLRIWSAPDQFIRQARQLPVARLGNAIRKLADIDYAAKTSRGTVRAGLEKFIVQFCQSAHNVA